MFHCYAIYSIGVVLTFGAMEGRSLVFFGYISFFLLLTVFSILLDLVSSIKIVFFM